MEFTMTRASEWFFQYTPTYKVEINNLEDLKALQDKEGHPLVVNFREQKEGRPTITVYDDYIE